MSDCWDQQHPARDHRGRWQKGHTGNRFGKKKGTRNRWRRADPSRSANWKPGEWKLHFARSLQTAEGDLEQRRAAAFAECLGLWCSILRRHGRAYARNASGHSTYQTPSTMRHPSGSRVFSFTGRACVSSCMCVGIWRRRHFCALVFVP